MLEHPIYLHCCANEHCWHECRSFIFWSWFKLDCCFRPRKYKIVFFTVIEGNSVLIFNIHKYPVKSLLIRCVCACVSHDFLVIIIRSSCSWMTPLLSCGCRSAYRKPTQQTVAPLLPVRTWKVTPTGWNTGGDMCKYKSSQSQTQSTRMWCKRLRSLLTTNHDQSCLIQEVFFFFFLPPQTRDFHQLVWLETTSFGILQHDTLLRWSHTCVHTSVRATPWSYGSVKYESQCFDPGKWDNGMLDQKPFF